MKKIIIIVLCSLFLATVVTFVSSAVVRKNVASTCFVYDEAGFPLSFTETLEGQPNNDACLQYALSKAYPTSNFGNMMIDWLIYFAVLTTAGLLIFKKKRQPQPPAPQMKV